MLAIAKQQSLNDNNKINQKFQTKRSRSPPGSEPNEQNKVPRRPHPKSPRSPESLNGRSRRDEEVVIACIYIYMYVWFYNLGICESNQQW